MCLMKYILLVLCLFANINTSSFLFQATCQSMINRPKINSCFNIVSYSHIKCIA